MKPSHNRRPPSQPNGGEQVFFEHPMPKNLEAERSVLGGVLLDNQQLERAAEIAYPDDFLLDQHKIIFKKMLALSQAGKPIDSVTLMEALELTGELDAAGGAAYIGQLLDGVPRVANVAHYAEIVREHAQRRLLGHFGNNLSGAALEAHSDVAEMLERAESCLAQIRERESAQRGAVKIGDAVSEAMPLLTRVGSGQGAMFGNPTGYTFLDENLAGWVPGEFVILAGRPSKGKSALGALEFVKRAAQRGLPVYLFTAEMSRESVVVRMACNVARVDSHAFRRGMLRAEDWNRLTEALAEIAAWPVWIDDRPGMKSADVRWRLRAASRNHGIKLAVVDYIQLLRAPGRERYEIVSQVSNDLQAAARELGQASGGTMVGLAQLGRQADARRPGLADLRESGHLEQDADTVLFIYDEPQDGDDAPQLGQRKPYNKILEIAKQRNGPTDFTKLLFLPIYTGFEELAKFESESYSESERLERRTV